MPWGILWARVGVRVIFLSQSWQATHTNFVLSLLHKTVSLFPSVSLCSQLLIGILALSHNFSKLAFCFQRNPFRLSKAEAECGCLPLRWNTRHYVTDSVGTKPLTYFSAYDRLQVIQSTEAIGPSFKLMWRCWHVSRTFISHFLWIFLYVIVELKSQFMSD